MSYCQKIQSLRASSICFRFTVPVMNNAGNSAGEKGHIVEGTYWRLRNGSITLLTWFYQLGKLIKMRRSWLDAANDFSPSLERSIECFICRHSRPLSCQMKRPDWFFELTWTSCKPLVSLCYAICCYCAVLPPAVMWRTAYVVRTSACILWSIGSVGRSIFQLLQTTFNSQHSLLCREHGEGMTIETNQFLWDPVMLLVVGFL